MFGLLKRKDEEEFTLDTEHRLVVFDDDKLTVDIVYITEINDSGIVAAGKYVVPQDDCEVAKSPDGLVYFYRAPKESVQETQRLARLEQSIVLSQITQYKPAQKENPNLDMKFWAIAFLLFVAIIAAAF